MMKRTLPLVLLALALAAPGTVSHAQQKTAKGPVARVVPAPVEKEAAFAAKQLGKYVGQKTASGQLRRVWSKGKVLGFEFTALDPAMQKPGPAQQGLKKAYPKLMGELYCRKGSSSRDFIKRGGEVQLATFTRKGKVIHAARLTKCR